LLHAVLATALPFIAGELSSPFSTGCVQRTAPLLSLTA
jgi:hypothetical protein